MRLDRLRIGSERAHPAHQFRNLKNVTIDFGEEHWVTVVIGWNGTGKSNVLEALAIIFRDLICHVRTPAFAFQIEYQIGVGAAKRYVSIDADPVRSGEPFIIHVANPQEVLAARAGRDTTIDAAAPRQPLGRPTTLSAFLAEDDANLPRYVFSYYSGESRRMQEVFRPYLEKYDNDLRAGQDPGLKRLFFALPVHSQFVLLVFLTQEDEDVREVLASHLRLDPSEGLESVLFVLREPPWRSKEGDPRFWNARGVVRNFLARLYEVAMAPIEVSRRVATSMWNTKTLQFQYLYIKDLKTLRRLVGSQTPAAFFRDLESTHVSELLEEVRIRVRLRDDDGTVTFRELSEGEQQLLTVLGLLRFTAKEESLFLLDEPDTHLNPRWSVDYLNYLRRVVDATGAIEESSHVVMCTHNPMAIAELVKEQVQILQLSTGDSTRRVVARQPEMDPRGLGYAAIVTSDMFGIASSLDGSTQLLLETQRELGAKKHLSPLEQEKLDVINAKLDRLGFRFFHPDDEYSRYLRLRNDALAARFNVVADLSAHAVTMSRDDREELATRLIDELLNEESQGQDRK